MLTLRRPDLDELSRDEIDEVVDRLLAVYGSRCREEGAAHLTDILHRRTMIGLEPGWGREIHGEVAELAAPLVAWSADDVQREITAHDAYIAERLLVELPEKTVPELKT